MYRIFERIQGEKRELSLPEGSLLDMLIQEFNFPFDIELNLCLFGNIGNELFLDSRLEEKLRNEDKERLNKMVAGKIFRELHICYCCYFTETTLTFKNILHELHHLRDIFEIEGDGECTEVTEYIKNLIITHLNDFYAEFYATKRMIDLYANGVKGINLFSIIDLNLVYLKNNEKQIKKPIQDIFTKDISDSEKQLAIIYIIQHYIIKYVFYYLANYRAFQEKEFRNQLYEDHWNEFISNEVSSKIGDLLSKFKNKILVTDLDVIEQCSELKTYLIDITLNFYDHDFNEYVSEIVETRPVLTPFSALQDVLRSINLGWVEEMKKITSLFNLEWLRRFQELNKTLFEPFRRISALTKTFSSRMFNIEPESEDEAEEEEENG